MAFVHLHIHSCYSILDGKSRPKEIVSVAKKLGQNAIALTDHGVMHGVVEFYNEAKEQGIKPIIGCEVYVAPNSRFDKVGAGFKGEGGKNYYHLILLAETQQGYKNLLKIVSAGFTDGYYYKPRVDKELLEKYHEGLICTSACIGGIVPQTLLGDTFTGSVSSEDYEKAKEEAIWYRDTFGPNNYFIELQNHGIPEQLLVNPYLEKIAKEIGVKCIVANDAHYPERKDAKAHEVMLCIQTKAFLTDEDRFKFSSDDFYIKSEEEMIALFPGKQEYLNNTQEIADRCNVSFEFDGYKLPKFPVPNEYKDDHGKYLRKVCYNNFEKLYPDKKGWTPEHVKRFEEEFEVITSMGFVDYFLIVWDYINWAKEQKIFVGPSRGSSASSLICYMMGITSLTDPVEYGLLFQRFLNSERISMPDIDTDFQKDRREDVIQHVRELYGNDKVSNIVAIGTMKAKAALKDVCRVYQIPFEISNKLSKLIPSIPDITLEDAWKESPKLVEFIQSDKKYQEIWDMALQIEGLPRNISVHASGVIICDDKIAEYAPMMTVDGQTVVQFPMEVVEKIGLIKMDFLGLRTLDIFDYASRFIHKEKDKNFDISKISLNDMGVYDYLSSGNTSSVFQFESSGMTKYMKQLKPHSIEELAALNALYRPGPMDFIPDYIRNKNNPANITYALDTPEVRKILGNTYGLCTYQEQIMLIFQHVAGFTLGRADLVRKAMGKKKEKIMLEEFEHFKNGLHDEKNNIIGTRAKGIPDEAVNALLNQMKDFSKYAFNKSHAVAYSVVAYQTAWLKYHYPTEFMAATISSFIGKNDEIGKSISDALDMGLKLVPPRINESTNLFTPLKDGEILFSLNGIKNVGDKVANAIIEERELNGPFKSFFDFLSRTKKYSIGDSTIEALIKVNAFDFTGESRATLIENLSTFSKIAKESHQRKSNGQRSIFSLLSPERAESLSMPELIKYEDDKRVITEWEKELTSIYITYDPLEDFNFYLKDKQVYSPDKLIKAFKNGEQIPGNNIFMIGMVGDTGEFQTKKGTFMAKPILESKTASVPCVVFPKMYSRADFEPIKNKGIPVIISARISDNSEEENLELIVNKVSVIQSNDYFKSAGNRDNIYSVLPEGFGLSPVDGSKEKKMANTQGVVATTEVKGKPKGLYINVKEKELDEVIEYLYNNHGKTKTFLFIDKIYVRTNILVSATNELQGYLKDKLGQNNVWFNS